MNAQDAKSEFIEAFYVRLKDAVERSGLSPKDISVQAKGEKHAGFVSNILGKKPAISIENVAALATVLDESVDHLLGLTKFVTVRASTTDRELERLSRVLSETTSRIRSRTADDEGIPFLDTVLAWYRDSNGVLSSSDEIAKYCDVYVKPVEEEETVRPIYVGPESLMARTIDEYSVDGVNEILRRADKDTMSAIKEWKRIVADKQEIIFSTPTLLIDLPTGSTLEITYDKLELPIRSADGDELVLTFARRVAARKEIPQFVIEVGAGNPN